MIIQDGAGRWVDIPFIPQRIISLCPSQTETLCALGLETRILGITKFCIHPESILENIKIIGGTKNIHYDEIRDLTPDLIIGEKEENTKDIILQLEKVAPVYVTNVESISDAIKMILELGFITGKIEEALNISNQIASLFSKITKPKQSTAVYLIWKNPYMAAGGQTYINSILNHIGYNNLCVPLPGRYPEISIDWLKDVHPDFLFLSSEPYPFKEKHLIDLKNILPDTNIHIVDGEMFSWYGIRMIKTVDYFLYNFNVI